MQSIDKNKTEEYTKGKYQKALAKVESKATYDYSRIAEQGIFWWVDERRSVRRIVEKDQELERLLEVETTGEGLGKRYSIKGRSIIIFLRRYGPGIAFMSYQHNNNTICQNKQ